MNPTVPGSDRVRLRTSLSSRTPLRRLRRSLAQLTSVALLVGLWLVTTVGQSSADIAVVLKRSFIEKYAGRATLEADYRVAHTHSKAKSAKEDGDIHCSGTSDDIGLATVAEIVHASTQPTAIQRLVAAEGGGPIPVTGVWRLWPEHANGGEDYVQGGHIPAITNTNPPHIFEIHPLTEVDGVDVRSSLTKVSGYKYKKDVDSFAKFESWPCEIHVNGDKVTLVTKQLGYNYTRFKAQLLEDPTHQLDDGHTSVFCAVQGPEPDDPIVAKVRCIFVKDSPPDVKLSQLHAGDVLKVIGVPRINLALLRHRVEHASDDPSLLTRSLPYEMIIVAVEK